MRRMLLYPLSYFRLSKPGSDILCAFIFAGVIASPFIFIPGASFFRSGGFLDKILVLTSALTGFYVAALVAAATFNSPDLDKTISSGPIALIAKDSDGNRIREELSRREFVCIIFGYLAFVSLVISIASAIFGAVAAAASVFISETLPKYVAEYAVILRDGLILLVSLTVSHMVIVTCLGLYHLMDRLYRRDRQITTKKDTQRKQDAA